MGPLFGHSASVFFCAHGQTNATTNVSLATRPFRVLGNDGKGGQWGSCSLMWADSERERERLARENEPWGHVGSSVGRRCRCAC